MGKIVQIGVIGSSEASEKQIELAHKVGQVVGKSGAVLICGGRDGIMGAACKGCKESGGITIGILPGKDGLDGNDFLDVQIRTGLGYARNSVVANSSDVVIVVGGSHGTLSEMCFASFEGKPIIVIEGSGGWGEELAGRKLGEEGREIKICKIEELQDILDKYLKS